MQPWRIVHILVRWAMLVVAEAEGGSDHYRLPVLSELQLGRFMSRSDATTCIDLAMDILRSMHGDQFSEEQLSRVIVDMRRSSAASDFRRSAGYSRDTDSLVVARRLLAAVERQVRMEHDRRMFWTCCRTTNWTQATRLLPGRDWQSVRDDFRRFADVLWTAEAIEIAAATDQMSRVMEQKRAAA